MLKIMGLGPGAYEALTIGALGVVLLLAIISLTTIIAFINYIK